MEDKGNVANSHSNLGIVNERVSTGRNTDKLQDILRILCRKW